MLLSFLPELLFFEGIIVQYPTVIHLRKNQKTVFILLKLCNVCPFTKKVTRNRGERDWGT